MTIANNDYLIVTGVDSSTGLESLPFVFTDNLTLGDGTMGNVRVTAFWNLAQEYDGSAYFFPAGTLGIRLNQSTEAQTSWDTITTGAWMSILFPDDYGGSALSTFTVGTQDLFDQWKEILRVMPVRLTSIVLPANGNVTTASDTERDFQIDFPWSGMFDWDSVTWASTGADYVRCMSCYTPLGLDFTNTLYLPEVNNLLFYTLYKMGPDLQFHEIDTTELTSYTFGANSTYTDSGAAPVDGRIYAYSQRSFNYPDFRPKEVSFYKQRKIFGGSRAYPSTLWFSQVGEYSNFSIGTSADSGMEVTLASQTSDLIQRIVPFENLFIFTEQNQWKLTPEDALTPENVSFNRIGNVPSSDLYANLVDGKVTFANAIQNDVIQLVFDYTNESFYPFRLTTIARHIFEDDTIVSMASITAAQNIVCVVFDTGDAAIATVNTKDNIIAWSRWTFVNPNDEFKWVVEDPAGHGFFFVINRDDGTETDTTVAKIERYKLVDTTIKDSYDEADDTSGSSYTMDFCTLPFENDVVSIDKVSSLADVFLKVAPGSTAIQCSIDSLMEGTSGAVEVPALPTGGTHRLIVNSDWNYDNCLKLVKEDDGFFELLSCAVSGRVNTTDAERRNV